MVRKERAERLRYGMAAWCHYTHQALKASFEQVVGQSELLVRGMSERGELIASLQKVKESYELALRDYQANVRNTIEAQDTQIGHLEARLQQGRQEAGLVA